MIVPWELFALIAIASVTYWINFTWTIRLLTQRVTIFLNYATAASLAAGDG